MASFLNAIRNYEGLRRFFFNRKGYNKLGLLYNDILYETPAVKEAIRRLPPKIRDERVYRIIRAMQLEIQHEILPKEQWTKYEDDVRYLKPYLEEVNKEIAERKLLKKNPLSEVFGEPQ